MYCKLPQDAPLAVRGARNYPCMGKPGKRAPTVEICDSDKPYEPLAMRQHILGPYPLDPNLLSQGVPPDSRINEDDHIFGPVEGTPLGPPPSAPPPPSTIPSPAPAVGPPAGAAEPRNLGPPGPADTPAPPIPGAAPAAPSAFSSNRFQQRTSLAFAQYDPGSGRYVTPDGQTYQRSDLVNSGAAKTWKDLILAGHG
jgi:phospholipid/cholesterol/gamma-HCH transport system substrate-binding protein